MPLQIRRAGVTRFKFAVPIVGDMRNLRYRRLQYDNADSEFGDFKKPNIKKIHCFQAVDFLLVTQYSFCPLPCFLANLISKKDTDRFRPMSFTINL